MLVPVTFEMVFASSHIVYPKYPTRKFQQWNKRSDPLSGPVGEPHTNFSLSCMSMCYSISKGLECLSSNLGVKDGYCITCKIPVMGTTTMSFRKIQDEFYLCVLCGGGLPNVPGFVDTCCLVYSLPPSHVLSVWLQSRFVALPIHSLCKSFYLVIRLHFGVNCNRLGIVSQTRVRSESSDKWGRHCCFEHLRRGEWIYQEWKRRAC